MITIDSSELARKMEVILSKYGDDVTESVRCMVKKVGSEARAKLKEVSPRNTGKYAEGWRTGEFTWSTGGGSITVYNAKKPVLAHLLENGHALRSGGRAPAKVHIKPVEDMAKETLEKYIRRAIGEEVTDIV